MAVAVGAGGLGADTSIPSERPRLLRAARTEVGRGPGGAGVTGPTRRRAKASARRGTHWSGRPWPNGYLWSGTLFGNYSHDSL